MKQKSEENTYPCNKKEEIDNQGKDYQEGQQGEALIEVKPHVWRRKWGTAKLGANKTIRHY